MLKSISQQKVFDSWRHIIYANYIRDCVKGAHRGIHHHFCLFLATVLVKPISQKNDQLFFSIFLQDTGYPDNQICGLLANLSINEKIISEGSFGINLLATHTSGDVLSRRQRIMPQISGIYCCILFERELTMVTKAFEIAVSAVVCS